MERTESSRQNLQQQSTDGRHGTNNPEGRVSRNGDCQQLRRDAPAFEQRGSNVETRERGYKTGNSDSVSLMILPAIINNGRRALKVNVMLDPCTTSSYVSETAAERTTVGSNNFWNRWNGSKASITLSRVNSE